MANKVRIARNVWNRDRTWQATLGWFTVGMLQYSNLTFGTKILRPLLALLLLDLRA